MLSGQAGNTNFIVFGLTRQTMESIIYLAQGKHAYYYITDVVSWLIGVNLHFQQ
jgi:hypothetical protein